MRDNKFDLEVGDYITFEMENEMYSCDEDNEFCDETELIEYKGLITSISRLNDGHILFQIDNNDYSYNTAEIHNISRISISQSAIKKKLSAFLSMECNSLQPGNLDDIQPLQNKKEIMENGLCHGFAVTHSYMAAKRMSQWWEDLLIIAAKWDGEIASLDSPINSRTISLTSIYTNKKDVTYRELYEKIIHYILYNYGDENRSGIPNLQQSTFLLPEGPFVSEDGGIQTHLSFSGHYTAERLEALLEKMESSSPIEGIILLDSLTHTCSLRYSTHEKAWFFYDPNSNSGEERFNRKDLIHAILDNPKHHLGKDLNLQIASWKKPEETSWAKDLSAYSAQFYDFNNKNNEELLNNFGLFQIIYRTPHQLPIILDKSLTNPTIKEKIINTLPSIHYGTGFSFLYTLISTDPNELKNIFKIAESDSHFKEKLIESFKVNSKEGWSALHAALEFTSNELKDKTIEYLGGPNVIIEELYRSFRDGTFDNDLSDLNKYIKYIISSTPESESNSGKPTLTIESLKYAKEILQEGVLVGAKKSRIPENKSINRNSSFSGRITPIVNEDLKRHLAAHADKTPTPKL